MAIEIAVAIFRALIGIGLLLRRHWAAEIAVLICRLRQHRLYVRSLVSFLDLKAGVRAPSAGHVQMKMMWRSLLGSLTVIANAMIADSVLSCQEEVVPANVGSLLDRKKSPV